MSKTLQTVVEIATEKYPVHHIEDIGDINTEARLAFISGYKAANQAVQGYRDALLEIESECTRSEISITHIVAVAQQALSAAPTTQQTNVLDELEKYLITCKGNIFITLDDLLTKIQQLKSK